MNTSGIQVPTTIEKQLQAELGAKSFFWYGRAATALYYAYCAIVEKYKHISEPEIILPAMSCATPANVALQAGLKVRFADIDINSGLITPETVKARFNENTIAVLFIHLYGNTQNLEPLKNWCIQNQVALIEDLAQSLGGVFPNGKPMGFYGDFSVYSFNPTKIIETGGGLLLLKNENYADILCELQDKLPIEEVSGNVIKKLALSYRDMHHYMVSLLRNRDMSSQHLNRIFLKTRGVYDLLNFRKFRNAEPLENSWQKLPEILEDRKKKASIYESLLGNHNDYWQILDNGKESNVCWRFSLIIKNPDKLVEFSEIIRKDGFHVSNLYWTLNDFFYPEDVCPKAEDFSRGIVNLWVNANVEDEYVENCAKSLLKHKNILKQ